MLQVQKVKEGLWIRNGKKRVFVNDYLLDNHPSLQVRADNNIPGDVVYDFTIPLELNESYEGDKIIPQSNMVVLGVGSGCAYQYRDRFILPDNRVMLNGWVSTIAGEWNRELPLGVFTIIHLGDDNA